MGRTGKCPGNGRGNWIVSHGSARRGARAPEYGVWAGIWKRCTKATGRDYDNYQGRGISVCEQWKDFPVFLADMGPRPSPDHSIERVNNDGNYEPSNCRWATKKEQANNKRPRKRKAACVNGHAFDETNTYFTSKGSQACRTCRAAAMKRLQASGYFKALRNGTKRDLGASPHLA